MVFTLKGNSEKNHNFRVRIQNVLNALIWLKQNNSLYKNIEIDYTRIDSLPQNNYIDVEDVTVDKETEEMSYDEGPCVDSKCKSQLESTSFLASHNSQPLEQNRLNQILDNELDIGTEPINEFSTPCLATLAFPTLFPDGIGDPTNKMILREISQSETESFSLILKHLIKFGEKRNGKWHYRFASHPRFGYWAYNMIYRKRLLSQGNYYMKQNIGDSMLTVEELREMLQSNNYTQLMNKLVYYAKNITGTNSYWYQVKEQLKATLHHVGSPTIFWTLSCAEFHWPEFHELF